MPDLAARLNWKGDWGMVSIAGLGRQIWVSQENQPEHSAWGGAVSLAAKITAGARDNASFMLNYGNALGRYATLATYPDAELNSQGDLELLTVETGMLAYQHYWNNDFRSTVAYGISQAELPDYADATMTRRAQSVHANLFWSPMPQFTFGLEYIYALRELKNTRTGDMSRLEFMSKFNF